MSNLKTFAEEELDILVKSAADPDNRPIVEPFIPEILALIDKIGNSGQSGGSMAFTAAVVSNTIRDLCLFHPICPITGHDDEWEQTGNIPDFNSKNAGIFQNKRCYSLFKDEFGNAYYLDAIVWKDQSGGTWNGSAIAPNGDTIRSRQFVKSFPFEPKTFVIDAVEKEIGKEGWDLCIKDPDQLKEVFKYYKSPN